MTGSNTSESQTQKAKRMRERIEDLKSGRRPQPPDGAKSLRERIEERANLLRGRDQPPKS
jgi:hypothetical protein